MRISNSLPVLLIIYAQNQLTFHPLTTIYRGDKPKFMGNELSHMIAVGSPSAAKINVPVVLALCHPATVYNCRICLQM